MFLNKCTTCERSLAVARGLQIPWHQPRSHYSTKMGNHEKTAQGFAGWDAILSRPLELDEIENVVTPWNGGDYRLQTFVDNLPSDVTVLFSVVHLPQE